MVDSFILMICLNLQTPDPSISKYYYACNRALTAATMQSNLKSTLDNYQHKIENDFIEKTNKELWGTGGFAYAVAIKHEIKFSVSAKPVAQNLNMTIDSNGEHATLSWSF